MSLHCRSPPPLTHCILKRNPSCLPFPSRVKKIFPLLRHMRLSYCDNFEFTISTRPTLHSNILDYTQSPPHSSISPMADIANIASLADKTTRMKIADPEGKTTRTNIIGAEVECRGTSSMVHEGDLSSMNTIESGGETPSTNIVDLEGNITTTNITDTEARPFQFFRLPRELRDSIYDLMHDTVPVKLCDEHEGNYMCTLPEPRLTIRNAAPYIPLLILNKQSRAEYKERFRVRTIVLQLHYVSNTEFGEPVYCDGPLPLIKSINMDLTLIIDRGTSMWSIQRWLRTVLHRVTNAENVIIRMSVWIDQEIAQEWQEWRERPGTCAIMDSFVQMLQPTTLALYSRDEDIDDEGVRGPKTEQLREKWTAEGGWKTKT